MNTGFVPDHHLSVFFGETTIYNAQDSGQLASADLKPRFKRLDLINRIQSTIGDKKNGLRAAKRRISFGRNRPVFKAIPASDVPELGLTFGGRLLAGDENERTLPFG